MLQGMRFTIVPGWKVKVSSAHGLVNTLKQNQHDRICPYEG